MASDSRQFPPTSAAEWRAALAATGQAETRTNSLDGEPLEILPQGAGTALQPGARAATIRATPILIAQALATEDLSPARVQAERAGGVNFLELRVRNIHGVGGLLPSLNAANPTEIRLALDAGPFFYAAAAAAVAHRGASQEPLHLAADPIGAALTTPLPESLPGLLQSATAVAVWATTHAPAVTALDVGGERLHSAGCDAAQELGFSMATAVAYLRTLIGAGINVDAACQQISVTLAADADLFLSIAKLRAARVLWHRIAAVCGANVSSSRLQLRVRVGSRALSTLSPWVNLLRCTVGAVGAAVVNADCIIVPPHSAREEHAEMGPRLARNLQHMLHEESHLGAVADPAGGAFAQEERTRALAEQAWDLLQDVERRGGMVAAVTSGWVTEQVLESRTKRLAAVQSRDLPLVGVSDFVDLSSGEPMRPEQPSEDNTASGGAALPESVVASWGQPSASHFEELVAAFAAAPNGLNLDQVYGGPLNSDVARLTMAPLDEPFQQLRRRAAAANARPAVSLVQLGSAKENAARTGFARRAFTAGGFVNEAQGFATDTPVSPVVCVCGTDGAYESELRSVIPALRAAGAQWVVVAGKPTDTARETGVDAFVHIGCDLVAVLDAALTAAGA
ncbi:MAG: methylmalonyl-CoA mutase family protein [Planctomycetota bacterium]